MQTVKIPLKRLFRTSANSPRAWKAMLTKFKTGKDFTTILTEKTKELLEPIYRKVMRAIKAVAKENGYTYVFNSEALLVMPPADDLLPLVAKKLNVKVPPATAAVK